MNGLRDAIFMEEMKRFMVSREQMVLLIRDYTLDSEEPNGSFSSMRRGYFEEQSYHNWAAEELIRYVQESETSSPILAVEEFMQMTRKFATWNEKSKNAFTAAYELAEDVLDVCRGAGWVEEY